MQIELRSVTAANDGRPALRAVSLAIGAGELLALLGPSGAGKSTLLLAIAGLHPVSGEIRFDGEPAAQVPVRARGIGMVFQDLGLWPHLTVAEHLRFVLAGSVVPRAEHARCVQATLATLELAALAPRLPAQLSGGEATRLALARALVGRPRVLLLDEPLAGLDRSLRERMLELLGNFHRQHRPTTVLVTHDYDEALAVAHRVAVLHAGSLLQVAAPDATWRRPESAVVAELSGPVSLVGGARDGVRVHLPLGTFAAEFAAGAGAGAGAPVRAVLRPHDVTLADGTGATVSACRFRAGRFEAAVEAGGVRVWGVSTQRREPGAAVAVRLQEPVWCVAGAPP